MQQRSIQSNKLQDSIWILTQITPIMKSGPLTRMIIKHLLTMRWVKHQVEPREVELTILFKWPATKCRTKEIEVIRVDANPVCVISNKRLVKPYSRIKFMAVILMMIHHQRLTRHWAGKINNSSNKRFRKAILKVRFNHSQIYQLYLYHYRLEVIKLKQSNRNLKTVEVLSTRLRPRLFLLSIIDIRNLMRILEVGELMKFRQEKVQV